MRTAAILVVMGLLAACAKPAGKGPGASPHTDPGPSICPQAKDPALVAEVRRLEESLTFTRHRRAIAVAAMITSGELPEACLEVMPE